MATIRLTIDGREIECEQGTMVLQAALDNGIFIPHYCYHPALSVAGNCRMCLVEIVPKVPPGRKPPPLKPAISCATEACEGMEILTDSPMVAEARRGVLESLLINHPLDCPVCDQAGECDLQNFSYAYGQAESRFLEQKNIKHAKDLGPEVRLYGNRCINCTRCVRFTQEISGTSDLCQTNRGGRNAIDTFPGLPFDSPLSGNVVDLCPVGSLVSRDFLHRGRVWQLDRTPSVCPHCSAGCTIEVHTRDELILRLKPRPNKEVNGFFICDTGRLGYKYVTDPARIASYEHRTEDGPSRMSFHGALDLLAERLREAGDDAYAIASPWLTNEELFLLRSIVPVDRIAFVGRPSGEERRFFAKWGDSERNPSLPGQYGRGALREDGATFVIEADRNPNRRGAQLILGDTACRKERLDEVLERAKKGEVKVLLVLSSMPGFEPEEALLEAVAGASFAAVVDILPGPLTEAANLVLPGAAFPEKEGTCTNSRGTTQRLVAAVPTQGQARPELELLYYLGGKLGIKLPGFTYRAVFTDLAATAEAFAKLTWEGLAPPSEPWWLGRTAMKKGGATQEPLLPTPVVVGAVPASRDTGSNDSENADGAEGKT
ncbi:2Fe-2S iron-sulfur cluster-binding protein [Planctomycetota bacterium]